MTAKHNARVARDNLYVTKQRAAAALSDPKKHGSEARQRVLAAKTRTARALSNFMAALPQQAEAQTPADAAGDPKAKTSEGS
jgi:hypothetical protein